MKQAGEPIAAPSISPGPYASDLWALEFMKYVKITQVVVKSLPSI